jgi:hypothetical protein
MDRAENERRMNEALAKKGWRPPLLAPRMPVRAFDPYEGNFPAGMAPGLEAAPQSRPMRAPPTVLDRAGLQARSFARGATELGREIIEAPFRPSAPKPPGMDMPAPGWSPGIRDPRAQHLFINDAADAVQEAVDAIPGQAAQIPGQVARIAPAAGSMALEMSGLPGLYREATNAPGSGRQDYSEGDYAYMEGDDEEAARLYNRGSGKWLMTGGQSLMTATGVGGLALKGGGVLAKAAGASKAADAVEAARVASEAAARAAKVPPMALAGGAVTVGAPLALAPEASAADLGAGEYNFGALGAFRRGFGYGLGGGWNDEAFAALGDPTDREMSSAAYEQKPFAFMLGQAAGTLPYAFAGANISGSLNRQMNAAKEAGDLALAAQRAKEAKDFALKYGLAKGTIYGAGGIAPGDQDLATRATDTLITAGVTGLTTRGAAPYAVENFPVLFGKPARSAPTYLAGDPIEVMRGLVGEGERLARASGKPYAFNRYGSEVAIPPLEIAKSNPFMDQGLRAAARDAAPKIAIDLESARINAKNLGEEIDYLNARNIATTNTSSMTTTSMKARDVLARLDARVASGAAPDRAHALRDLAASDRDFGATVAATSETGALPPGKSGKLRGKGGEFYSASVRQLEDLASSSASEPQSKINAIATAPFLNNGAFKPAPIPSRKKVPEMGPSPWEAEFEALATPEDRRAVADRFVSELGDKALTTSPQELIKMIYGTPSVRTAARALGVPMELTSPPDPKMLKAMWDSNEKANSLGRFQGMAMPPNADGSKRSMDFMAPYRDAQRANPKQAMPISDEVAALQEQIDLAKDGLSPELAAALAAGREAPLNVYGAQPVNDLFLRAERPKGFMPFSKVVPGPMAKFVATPAAIGVDHAIHALRGGFQIPPLEFEMPTFDMEALGNTAETQPRSPAPTVPPMALEAPTEMSPPDVSEMNPALDDAASLFATDRSFAEEVERTNPAYAAELRARIVRNPRLAQRSSQ